MTLEEAIAAIAALTARVAELEASLTEAKGKATDAEATAELTDEEKARMASLSASEAQRFRALDKSARLAEVAKALEADPVVAVIGKDVYRKSTPGAELAIKFVAQQAEIEKAKDCEFAKSVLGGAPGEDAIHIALVKAVRVSGETAEAQTKMVESLKGLTAEFRNKRKAAGAGGEVAPAGGVALKAAVEEYQKLHGIAHYEIAFNKALSSDPKVRHLYEASRAES